MWFRWTGQTPDSLLLTRLIQGLKTLPDVGDGVVEGVSVKTENPAAQIHEDSAESSTALETVKQKDKRTLIKEAAESLDKLLLDHAQNKAGLCIADRKNDLRFIKDYQQALRVAHAAPDRVLGAVLGIEMPQLGQQPLAKGTEENTQQAELVSATLSEIASDDKEVKYEEVELSSKSRATTVEEVPDEEAPLKHHPGLSSGKGKEEMVKALTQEKTFRQAWEDLKVVARGIEEIAKPEDSLFQKTCLTILDGFDKFLGFVPFLPVAVNAIKYACYNVRKGYQEVEWENRNAVRKALIKISAAILAAPDAEEMRVSGILCEEAN